MSSITFVKIAEWYHMFYEEGAVITESQLDEYVRVLEKNSL